MMGLLGDGWFYISAGGFLVSAVLFVFLLGQYRAAVEAEDEALPADGPEPVPLTASPSEKVYTPKVAAPPEPVKSVAAEPAPAPKAAKTAEPEPKVDPANITFSGKKSESSTGGISPAVVYLQNMKLQMDRLDKDITGLKSIAAQQNTHTDLILKKLGELSDKVAAVADVQRAIAEGAFGGASAQPAAAPAPAAASTPAPAPAGNAAPDAGRDVGHPADDPVRTIDLQPEAAAEPKPEPKPKKAKAVVPEDAAPDKTLVIEPTVAPIKLGGSDVPLPARPGFEEPKAETPAPAAAPSIELKPINGSQEPSTEAPKPARKGPVWPI